MLENSYYWSKIIIPLTKEEKWANDKDGPLSRAGGFLLTVSGTQNHKMSVAKAMSWKKLQNDRLRALVGNSLVSLKQRHEILKKHQPESNEWLATKRLFQGCVLPQSDVECYIHVGAFIQNRPQINPVCQRVLSSSMLSPPLPIPKKKSLAMSHYRDNCSQTHLICV